MRIQARATIPVQVAAATCARLLRFSFAQSGSQMSFPHPAPDVHGGAALSRRRCRRPRSPASAIVWKLVPNAGGWQYSLTFNISAREPCTGRFRAAAWLS
jgi:hypothetical protein